jgi:hypothetical protein
MEPICGLDVALHYIGGKWKPILLFHLQGEPRRFGELKRLAGGISEKVLIQQLRSLVEDGIVTIFLKCRQGWNTRSPISGALWRLRCNRYVNGETRTGRSAGRWQLDLEPALAVLS